MVVRKVVELTATRPTQPSSFHSSFRCDGESLAEILDDAAVRGDVAGRRRKLPPGMARRSSRHWARPEPERAPQERTEPDVSGSLAPCDIAPVQQQREREPEPKPEIAVDLTQLLSDGKNDNDENDEEDPEMIFASALISAASEGDSAEVTRLLEVADINTALEPTEDIDESWHGATALIAAAVRSLSTSVERLLPDLWLPGLIDVTVCFAAAAIWAYISSFAASRGGRRLETHR